MDTDRMSKILSDLADEEGTPIDEEIRQQMLIQAYKGNPCANRTLEERLARLKEIEEELSKGGNDVAIQA